MKYEPFYFKRILFSFFWGFVPFYLIIGILSLLNVVPASFNGKQYYGFVGFVIILSMLVFSSLILSLVCWLFLNLGVFIRNTLFARK